MNIVRTNTLNALPLKQVISSQDREFSTNITITYLSAPDPIGKTYQSTTTSSIILYTYIYIYIYKCSTKQKI